VLYKVTFGNSGKYYLHKGKKLDESVDRFLDDVYRGMRGKGCPDTYSKVVDFCKKYPAIHKVGIEIVSNAPPDTILKKEAALYKSMKKDEDSLNRLDIAPYKPEWMIREALQKRCENCLKSGVIGKKKTAFKFCPNCGRLNK
jgi:hypothetical protein